MFFLHLQVHCFNWPLCKLQQQKNHQTKKNFQQLFILLFRNNFSWTNFIWWSWHDQAGHNIYLKYLFDFHIKPGQISVKTDPPPKSITTWLDLKCDMWHIKHDMWHLTCGVRHVTNDTWHVIYDMLWEVNILLKFQLSSTYYLWFMIFWQFGWKCWLNDWLNEWMHSEAVCRTARTTQGLLITNELIEIIRFVIHAGIFPDLGSFVCHSLVALTSFPSSGSSVGAAASDFLMGSSCGQWWYPGSLGLHSVKVYRCWSMSERGVCQHLAVAVLIVRHEFDRLRALWSYRRQWVLSI